MILSDQDIFNSMMSSDGIRIDPLHIGYLKSASVDLRLGEDYWKYREPNTVGIIDVMEDVKPMMISFQSSSFLIPPRGFMLGVTMERVQVPLTMAARLDGKSSLGRLGLIVHLTAGNIDPGFNGNITLELFNTAPYPIKLYAGMPIAQIVFIKLTSPCKQGYSGKYQGATGCDPSRMHLNWRSDGK
jgi:dCTP deaminase